MIYYQQLLVWQKSMDLVVEVYSITRRFPKEEMFALTSQIRRAVVSVPSNIAEGAGRKSTRDYLHFLKIANGSLNEVETQMILSERLGYLQPEALNTVAAHISEIGRMLSSMIQKLTGNL